MPTPSPSVSRQTDADGNGLIEISTQAELNNVRYDLTGASYCTGPNAVPNTTGCPEGGCRGYELTADLDFDRDGDGSTWVRGDDGRLTLGADDNHPDYFDTAAGGWLPIGTDYDGGITIRGCTNYTTAFSAIFDGGGHTISGLATLRDLDDVISTGISLGLFDSIVEGADIRNIGLVGNLAKYTGTSGISASSLVGRMWDSSITASHTTVDVVSGADNDWPVDVANSFSDDVGGLVGTLGGSGSITASYATGDIDVDGVSESRNKVGGLVGFQGTTLFPFPPHHYCFLCHWQR